MSLLIMYTSGRGGEGKSYRRGGEFVLNEFLPDFGEDSVLHCNYPIKFDEWVDCKGVTRPGLVEIAKNKHNIDEDEVRRRIQLFPEDEIDAWLQWNNNSGRVDGPWTYFADNKINIDKAHIAIDEIHNFVPVVGGNDIALEWARWLGEIRHEGATIEFLTQADSKVHKTIKDHATIRLEIESSVHRRDPFFKVPLGDWYSFWTIFGRAYKPSSWQITKRQTGGKWVQEVAAPFWFKDEIYGIYDTNSKPQSGQGKAGTGRKLAHERLTKGKLFGWFLGNHWWRFIFNRLVATIAFIVGFFVLSLNFQTVLAYITNEMEAANKASTEQGGELEITPVSAIAKQQDAEDEEELRRAAEEQLKYELLLTEWITQQAGNSVIVGMTGDKVVVATGDVLGVGDNFRFGAEQKTISRIDYAGRKVFFVGGQFVRFRRDHGMSKSLAAENATSTELLRLLRERGEAVTARTETTDTK